VTVVGRSSAVEVPSATRRNDLRKAKVERKKEKVRRIIFAFYLLPFTFSVAAWPTDAIAAEETKEATEEKELKAPLDPKEAKEIREVVKKLQARYEQTRDLQADFTQTTQIEGFATPITSSGRVYIKKPGRLRWDYLDPNVEEIYVNQNDVMMYVPEHKQVLVGRLTQMAASQAPLQLLQGVAKLEEQFEVEPVAAGRGEGGLPLITLLPRPNEPDSVRTVMKIVLGLQPKTHYIKTVAIHEVSGNIARFEFSRLKPNSGLKNSMFEFVVPEGVEVVKAPVLSPP
jgi:outer membrane lipoprotein carrier protein